ncbi:MAG: high-potential iron-sulfur protein, partial [Rudaea sp.]
MRKVDNSTTQEMDCSRRRFFVGAGTALGAVALAGILPRSARAADLPHLTPDDATAKALNYTEDSSKVDAAKSPTHVAGAACANCN